MTKVRAPMLLDSQMQEVRRIEPAGASIVLNLTPPSTADITVMFDRDDPIPMRSWVRLYTIHGDAGVYRVSASDTQYDSDEQRLTLEHGITSLRDTVVPSLSDRTADSEVKKMASEMLSWLLAKQNVTMWQAGSCAATENVILDQNDSSLLEMLLDMMDQLPEYDLDLDQSSFPWTVSIVEKTEGITAEGRLSRNLGSVRVTYDDSELCTRVYATGLDGGYMDADTQSTYGVVEGSLYLNSDTKRAEAERIATRYLEKRKSPAISVELDAVDLSKATNETIDAFLIGKKFRLTIPTYGLIVDQWITGIRYADVYGDPEHVVLTLGNRIADIAQRASKTAKSASNAGKSASGGGGGGARSNAALIAQDRIVLSDHNETIVTIRQGASAWREMDSEITINDAIVRMFTQSRDIYGDTARLKEGIVSTLTRAGVYADASQGIVQLFTTYLEKHEKNVETHSSLIETNRQGILMRVAYGEVASQLAIEADNITLSSGKIVLDGYVTTQQLETLLADMGTIYASIAYIDEVVAENYFQVGTKQASWQSMEVVTSVSSSTDRKDNLAIANSAGNAVIGATSFSYVKSVSKSTETIYYLGNNH